MSKGIVKKTPWVTKAKHPGKLLVKEIEGESNQGMLDTEIDFYSDYVVVLENDYVEFALNLAGPSTATKVVLARGMVTETNNSSDGLGRLKVTVPNPGSNKVKDEVIPYYNYDSLPLATGDYVEYRNASETSCDVARKIDCIGTVKGLPRTVPGSLLVNKVPSNSGGVAANSTISFGLPSTVTAPLHLNDVIEFRVTGVGEGEFVQLLLPGTH